MAPPRKTIRLSAANPGDIDRAATMLRDGGTVAFPTETVYGLGANALDADAVEKIFVAKQRPHWDPLIVHLAERSQLGQVAEPQQNANALMDAFWPGPLTLLLPRTAAVPDAVTAGRPLVGVRIPAHPVARALLKAAGVPVAAPSANRFGHISPTTAAHVLADLDGRIDAVLDGGATEVGLESTVAEARDGEVMIYRRGAVTIKMLRALMGAAFKVEVYREEPQSLADPGALPSPGVGMRHYAPRARLVLVKAEAADLSHSLLGELRRQRTAGASAGVLLPNGWAVLPGDIAFAWGSWLSSAELATRLYIGLRTLDERGVDVIVCPVPEGSGLAAAMRDRLQKAARAPEVDEKGDVASATTR